VGRSGIAVLAVATAFAVVPSAHAATAYFSVTPDAALIGTTFVFDAGDSQGVHFQWDLDGEPGYEVDTGPSQQATKAYTGPGTMTARLLVTDIDGFTAEFSQTFTVLAPSIPEPTQDDVTAPVISNAKITPTAFRLGPKATPLNGAIARVKAKRGATLAWTLSEPANLLVRIQRCASKKKCTPHVTVKMHRTVAAGARSLAFSGRIELRKLKPGGYRFVLDATDLSDNFSETKYVSFVVLPG
jgi:hypothetical protein